MMDAFGMHGWGMGYGWIIGLILLIFIFFLVTKQRGTFNDGSQNTGESALDVLKKRYARGEIDKEEYEEKKKDLM